MNGGPGASGDLTKHLMNLICSIPPKKLYHDQNVCLLHTVFSMQAWSANIAKLTELSDSIRDLTRSKGNSNTSNRRSSTSTTASYSPQVCSSSSLLSPPPTILDGVMTGYLYQYRTECDSYQTKSESGIRFFFSKHIPLASSDQSSVTGWSAHQSNSSLDE